LNSNSLDFLSKDCRNNYHNKCSGTWHGLGLEVYCYCSCHGGKEVEALGWVEGPLSNARVNNLPFQEGTQND
jgi:hypothetical protein